MRPRDRRSGLPIYQVCACGKTYAPTLAIAKNLKREIMARTGRSNEVRFYECRHGSWHWTEMLEEPTLIDRKAS